MRSKIFMLATYQLGKNLKKNKSAKMSYDRKHAMILRFASVSVVKKEIKMYKLHDNTLLLKEVPQRGLQFTSRQV